MPQIPFTRFHQPNGRQTLDTIDVDADSYAQYEKVRDAGFRMTVELLPSGLVSMCIEEPELGDFDNVITSNGPEVVERLRVMLARFDRVEAAKWVVRMSE